MAEESAYDIVLRRVFEDPDFRERLLADPAGTWSEVTGVAVPDDVELVVLENGPKTVHIVLPDPSLSRADLDAGAHSGGRNLGPSTCISACSPERWEEKWGSPWPL